MKEYKHGFFYAPRLLKPKNSAVPGIINSAGFLTSGSVKTYSRKFGNIPRKLFAELR